MNDRMLPAVLAQPSTNELDSWRRDVRAIQNTPAVPEQFRGKPREIFAVWLMGREIGIPPMRSLHMFDVIDGRVSPRAELLTTLATRAGHKIEGDTNMDQATAHGVRGDTGAEMTVTVTYEEMSQVVRRGKKLVDGDNWKNYRQDMLWARAVSRLVRRLCPDVLAGSLAVYQQQDEFAPALTSEVIESPALELTEDDEGNVTLESTGGASAGHPANVDDAGDGSLASPDEPDDRPED